MTTTKQWEHRNQRLSVAIRTDASAEIGSGHLMRCLTLASELAKAGMHITFLCYKLAEHLTDQIQAAGLQLALLSEPWPVDLPNGGADLLIIDHYGADRDWQQVMRQQAKKIMVIDDLADRYHDCDLLLNQNLHAAETRYREKVPENCTLLLGSRYTLLRPEFYHLRPDTHTRSSLKRLLLCFGGSDPRQLTEHILRELVDCPWAIDVVLGAASPQQGAIESLCFKHQGRWTLHIQTAAMATLIAHADLAIGAGGSSHWERCLLGLPALVVTVADNQRESTRLLHERGACWWLGDVDSLPPGAIRNAVNQLAHNPQRLEQMSRVAAGVVPQDGGTRKVVKAIQSMLAADAI
ncbi:MAG: UDP-2,4-diacetamido-2,4,6-trideoxy-beta-L-altropyranose hydrolase [Pelovirga sp.]